MSTAFVTQTDDANIVTHGGKKFHGDDIFGIALLDMLLGDVRCYRIPYNENLVTSTEEKQIVFDTGGGKFDHHQKGGNGNHIRLNKLAPKAVPYASFGLLWEEYGKGLLIKTFPKRTENFYMYMHKYVDYHLVRGVDAADNGIFPYSLEIFPTYRVLSTSCVISFLNSDEELPDAKNEGLIRAVEFAKKALKLAMRRGEQGYKNGTRFNGYILKRVSRDFESTVLSAMKEQLKVYIGLDTVKIPGMCKDAHFTESAIGKLWASYADEFCKVVCSRSPEHVKEYISSIVYGFCAEALGIGYRFPNGLDDMECLTIGDMFYSKEEYGEGYEEDLKYLFKMAFESALKVATFKADSQEYVENAVRNTTGHILVLEERAYWQDWIANMPEAKKIWFVISPTESGTWKVKPVPCKYNPNGYRKGFPKKWFGYTKRSDVPSKFNEDVFFIHSSGFLAVCKTLESAKNLAELALGNQENKMQKEAFS